MRIEKVPGYDLLVSDAGDVYNLNLSRKAQIKNRNGYMYVCVWLKKEKKKKNILSHRLVSMAFLGDVTGKEVNHKDFKRDNNNLNNLEIVSRRENFLHALRAGRLTGNRTCKGEKCRFSNITDIQAKEIYDKLINGSKVTEIVGQYPIKKSAVYNILNKKHYKHIHDEAAA